MLKWRTNALAAIITVKYGGYVQIRKVLVCKNWSQKNQQKIRLSAAFIYVMCAKRWKVLNKYYNILHWNLC